ncbi:hypothetical protein [Desulfofustis glycolicus]|uniref:Uncharacterized protein n=1 Tax=Desulfofustis glycolicus DSM 9705 TaxID=1121409 RepID=A0A1M5S6Z2_9BACT|nr:hypothetical protein [Desulfofustis glycolicus]SHH34256.1 hypothetical protein SAMN02745124_00194 [Desulfofustis glycolicus DSM 9705]
MADTDHDYKGYILTGLPPGLFGETYIVIAISDSRYSRGFFVEYYIISSRPQESSRKGEFHVFANNLPEELGVINADFAISEGLRQAQVDIIQMQEERSVKLNRPDVAVLPFEIQEYNIPFLGFRMRGQFLSQLNDMLINTKCRRLANYLTLLQQVNPVPKTLS